MAAPLLELCFKHQGDLQLGRAHLHPVTPTTTTITTITTTTTITTPPCA